jgi:hypothetical protein
VTLEQISACLKAAKKISHYTDGGYTPHYGTNNEEFAKLIATLVRQEMLAIAQANLAFSNNATELYKDLQAYDRFEQGLNF